MTIGSNRPIRVNDFITTLINSSEPKYRTIILGKKVVLVSINT